MYIDKLPVCFLQAFLMCISTLFASCFWNHYKPNSNSNSRSKCHHSYSNCENSLLVNVNMHTCFGPSLFGHDSACPVFQVTSQVFILSRICLSEDNKSRKDCGVESKIAHGGCDHDLGCFAHFTDFPPEGEMG